MAKVTVSVSIPDSKRFSKVVKAAQKAGLEVEGAFDALGVATGSIEADRLSDLHRVEGIASVEPGREYKPAGSDQA